MIRRFKRTHCKCGDPLDCSDPTYCKKCRRAIAKKDYQANKERYKERATKARQKKLDKFHEFKSTQQCDICGENHSACLDFHHRDESEKKFEIANMLRYSWAKIEEELNKCDVLCANCHRKETCARSLTGQGP